MALGFTQPLTATNRRIICGGGESRRRVRLKTLQSVCVITWNMGMSNPLNSQNLYRPIEALHYLDLYLYLISHPAVASTSLLFNLRPGHFLWSQIDHGLNLTTHLHTVLCLWMSGAIPPRPSARSWRKKATSPIHKMPFLPVQHTVTYNQWTIQQYTCKFVHDIL